MESSWIGIGSRRTVRPSPHSGSHAEAEDAAQDAFVLAWQRIASFRGDASFRTWLLTIAWHQAINRRRTLVRWWKRTVPFDDEAIVQLKPWFDPDSSETASTTDARHTADRPAGGRTDAATDFAKGTMTAATDVQTDAPAENRRGSCSASSPLALSGASPGASQSPSVVSGFRRTFSQPSRFLQTAGRTPEQLVSSHEFRRDIVNSIRALSPTLRDTLLLTQSGDYTYAEIGMLLRVPLGTIKWRVAEARRLVKKRLRELGHAELG